MVRFLRRWRQKSRSLPKWDLSTPVVRWSNDDVWTIRQAVEGVAGFGGTGSGKTSGSGELLALAMLELGFGFLILTSKPGERQMWERYCRKTNRLGDFRAFGPNEKWRFNFLDYERNHKGDGAGITQNIVSYLMTILEVLERNSGSSGGRDEEGYWKRAMQQLARNLVDLLSMATGNVSIPDLYRLVVSAPTSPAQVCDATWQERSFCFQSLKAAEKREKTEWQKHDFGLVADYFLLEYPALSDKTRSVIVSTFTSMIDLMNRGVMRELFCSETNITPEAIENGAIILVDMASEDAR